MSQEYQKAVDEFREKNPDWGKGVYATVSGQLFPFKHLFILTTFCSSHVVFV